MSVNLIANTASKWLTGGTIYNMNTLHKRMIHTLSRVEQDSKRLHHIKQNSLHIHYNPYQNSSDGYTKWNILNEINPSQNHKY
jgi:hypothetical protein